jgi:hypothetical protein
VVLDNDLSCNILLAVRSGHAELASAIVSKDMKKNGVGSSFSKFHLEALVGDPGSAFNPP